MKLNLKLLATRFFQAEDEPPVPEDGVNRYLLDRVLRPCMKGDAPYLSDIDFDAFEIDDISQLENYYNRLIGASRQLGQFTQTVDRVPAAPGNTRAFC